MNGNSNRGRWLVAAILALALLLALIGLRYRQLSPRPAPPQRPAATHTQE